MVVSPPPRSRRKDCPTAGRQGGSESRTPSRARATARDVVDPCRADRSGPPPPGLEHTMAGLRGARLGSKDPRALSPLLVTGLEPLFCRSRAFPWSPPRGWVAPSVL